MLVTQDHLRNLVDIVTTLLEPLDRSGTCGRFEQFLQHDITNPTEPQGLSYERLVAWDNHEDHSSSRGSVVKVLSEEKSVKVFCVVVVAFTSGDLPPLTPSPTTKHVHSSL